MFIDGDYIVILGTQFGADLHTYALIYDTSFKSNIQEVKRYKFEGRYFAGRKNEQNGYIYLLSRQDPVLRPNPVPQYDLGDGYKNIPTASVFIYPGEYKIPKFINVICFNLRDPTNKSKFNMVSVVVDNVHKYYLTTRSLYFTVGRIDSATSLDFTFIHKIFLQDQFIVPFTDARVRGSVKNEFSLDEVKDFFRVITTTFKPAPSDRGIYITTYDFNLTRQVELFTQVNQDVQASRFTDDRLYFSTTGTSNSFYLV